jgi:Arc/MetJ-type ribon-helix-helix transcriptional regulator
MEGIVMAREKIGDDVMQVRFPDGTFARIDEVSSNRSEFIRYAVDKALKAGSGQRPKTDVPAIAERAVKEVPAKRVRSEKKIDGQAVSDGLRPDAKVLLEALRGKRMTSRDAEKAMGWMGLRYSKAEGQLLLAGAIRVEGGVLVAGDDA